MEEKIIRRKKKGDDKQKINILKTSLIRFNDFDSISFHLISKKLESFHSSDVFIFTPQYNNLNSFHHHQHHIKLIS